MDNWTSDYLRYGCEGSASHDSLEDAVRYLYDAAWDGDLSPVRIVAPNGDVAWHRDLAEDLPALAARLGV